MRVSIVMIHTLFMMLFLQSCGSDESLNHYQLTGVPVVHASPNLTFAVTDYYSLPGSLPLSISIDLCQNISGYCTKNRINLYHSLISQLDPQEDSPIQVVELDKATIEAHIEKKHLKPADFYISIKLLEKTGYLFNIFDYNREVDSHAYQYSMFEHFSEHSGELKSDKARVTFELGY